MKMKTIFILMRFFYNTVHGTNNVILNQQSDLACLLVRSFNDVMNV
jgi:hypothetical protein